MALDSSFVRVSEPGIGVVDVHACAVVCDSLQENSIEREHTVSRRHRRSVHSNREHELLLFPHTRRGIATSFSITPLDTEKATPVLTDHRPNAPESVHSRYLLRYLRRYLRRYKKRSINRMFFVARRVHKTKAHFHYKVSPWSGLKCCEEVRVRTLLEKPPSTECSGVAGYIPSKAIGFPANDLEESAGFPFVPFATGSLTRGDGGGKIPKGSSIIKCHNLSSSFGRASPSPVIGFCTIPEVCASSLTSSKGCFIALPPFCLATMYVAAHQNTTKNPCMNASELLRNFQSLQIAGEVCNRHYHLRT